MRLGLQETARCGRSGAQAHHPRNCPMKPWASTPLTDPQHPCLSKGSITAGVYTCHQAQFLRDAGHRMMDGNGQVDGWTDRWIDG